MELINQEFDLATVTIKDGYDSAWIDQIMTIHNKTDMGRAQEIKKMVNDAFASSFAVATAWRGNRLMSFGVAGARGLTGAKSSSITMALPDITSCTIPIGSVDIQFLLSPTKN